MHAAAAGRLQSHLPGIAPGLQRLTTGTVFLLLLQHLLLPVLLLQMAQDLLLRGGIH
jgi:hypothetical protein